MEERKTKSAALVFHRFAGAEFKEVTGFFCWDARCANLRSAKVIALMLTCGMCNTVDHCAGLEQLIHEFDAAKG
jgi:hypothetical protein